MLYNEERPCDFDSMVGQKDIVKNIQNQSKRNQFFQVYVFEGQFGSGKTTMARIVAMAANCQHKDENGNPCGKCDACKNIINGNAIDVVEMDAASNTGVDSIRNLKDTIEYLPAVLQKKIYIIDEVHMLSNGAFNALLKVLEEPPEQVMFILCTTEGKKIPSTVRSRAAMYHFAQIDEGDMLSHLRDVANRHGYAATDSGLRLICKNSEGAMRNALSILEQVAVFGDVNEDTVASMLGISDTKYLFELAGYLLRADRASAIRSVNEIFHLGKEPFLMVSDLIDICTDCLLATYGVIESVNGTQSYIQDIRNLSDGVSPEVFASMADGLMEIRSQLRSIPGKTTLVCGIIRMLSEKGSAVALLSAQIRQLQGRLDALEEKGGRLQEPVHDNADVVPISQESGHLTTSDGIKNEEPSEKSEPSAPREEETLSNTMEVVENVTENMQQTGVSDKKLNLEEATLEESTTEEPKTEEPSSFDSFDMFSDEMFDSIKEEGLTDDSENNEYETESDSMSETVMKTDLSKDVMDVDAVREYINDLCAADPMGPFLQNVLAFTCKEFVEEGSIVFETTQSSVVRILQSYEERNGGFPFLYRLKQAEA